MVRRHVDFQMNLGVLNLMNYSKKDGVSREMYGNWSSFSSLIQNGRMTELTVLTKLQLSSEAAKQIVSLVVQPIAANIGISIPASTSRLTSIREINWCMEVIGYGLSLPLTEHDTIRDCVHVYCEWLSALLPQPKPAVPLPLLKLPNHFSRKIIAHLHGLFIPRSTDAAPDMVSRQALLCHRVLRTFQQVVIQSSNIEEETWDCLLLFLLAINDALLSPPSNPSDIGDQLCDRVLSVLFEIWLQACVRSFPSPRLWRTLSDLAQTWRHRTSLISQWNRMNVALTTRLLRNLYGSSLLCSTLSNDEKLSIPSQLSGEALAQTWYRFLHLLGNPVQLVRSNVISQTPKFLQHTIVNPQVADPSQHPCLLMLPGIFVDAMKGISVLVDIFLGNPASLQARLEHKVFSSSANISGGNSRAWRTGSHLGTFFLRDDLSSLTPYRSRCNSLLHLFGSWLFEAALLDCDGRHDIRGNLNDTKQSSPLITDRSRASSVSVTSETPMYSNRPRSATVIEFLDFPAPSLQPSGYENGQAEALGALCRIFSSKKADEDILPQYLARFYVVLHHGLKMKEDRTVSEATASILLHSTDLLRVELDGIFSVFPPFVDALEAVLAVKDIKIRTGVNRVELRRASIHVLLSILALPLHFHQLQIKELASYAGDRSSAVLTFSQLRPRLMQLLLSAIQIENDSVNTHLLLGGLASVIHDLSTYEQADSFSHILPEFSSGQMQPDAVSTAISSSSDTHSCHSTSSTSYPSFSEVTSELQHESDVSFTEKLSSIGSTHTSPLWTFQGLVSAGIHIISHKLLSSWKADLNTSLAALEVLSSLAWITVGEQGVSESRRVVRVLCDYISLQCSRPPPAHSKDLHSTIVAAFTCCASWLSAQPYVIAADNDCLHAILQVVELGISGSKSQGKIGEPLKAKHEKDLKPVSLRVRDAAELLLTSLMEKVGNFSSPSGSFTSWDDSNLLYLESPLKNNFQPELPCTVTFKDFRHFATSDGAILSVLEQPRFNDQDPQPNVVLLLRNAFGKQVWTSQLRFLPRHKCGIRWQNTNPGRPLPMNDVGLETAHKPQYFPDVVDRVRTCLADKSMPSVDAFVHGDDHVVAELDKINRLVDSSLNNHGSMDFDIECGEKLEYQPPVVREKFQTARLLLAQIGFISLESLQEASSGGSSLIGINASPELSEELDSIDRIGSRTQDTVHVFYVRSGQKTVEEIVSNMVTYSLLDASFIEFINALGWPGHAGQHQTSCPGLTTSLSGSVDGSTSKDFGISRDEEKEVGGFPFNGCCRALYWADAFSEMFFVFLAETPSSAAPSPSPPFNRTSLERQSVRKLPVTDSSDDSDMHKKTRRSIRQAAQTTSFDFKMMVVWLESFEDHLNFPVGELMGLTNSSSKEDSDCAGTQRTDEQQQPDCFIIFIYPQQCGLYRIHLRGSLSRIYFATPLVDGAVVSRRALGLLVRQTSLNMAKRRRLDQESYQLPHVRRKSKISEIVARYRSEAEVSSFYTNLFAVLQS